MAGLLPLIRSNATALFPVTRTVSFLTAVNMALDASEQRWKRRPPLAELTLPYRRVSPADLATFKAFYESQKGPYDTTWGLVLGRAGLGTIDASSQTLTVTSDAYPLGPFTASHVGSQIVVAGAGVAAALLETTIDGYTDPATVTLADAASTGVSGADTRWGIYLPYMTLLDDSFQATEESDTRTSYGFSLHCRQTQNAGAVAGSPGGMFPALSTGVTTQFPYVQLNRYQVMVNDNPIGPRYSWTWFGGGLDGFPGASLHGWELHAPALTDAELKTWEDFYRAQWGRWSSFAFTDPDTAVSYAGCRFDSDTFEVQHLSPNINSVVLKIMEVNQPS